MQDPKQETAVTDESSGQKQSQKRHSEKLFENLVTYDEAAELIGVTKGTLRKWVQAGRLRAIRFGHRTVRFDPVYLRRWLLNPKGAKLDSNDRA